MRALLLNQTHGHGTGCVHKDKSTVTNTNAYLISIDYSHIVTWYNLMCANVENRLIQSYLMHLFII